jgi:hypothetical protein
MPELPELFAEEALQVLAMPAPHTPLAGRRMQSAWAMSTWRPDPLWRSSP